MHSHNSGSVAADERARIAALLRRYPDNTPDELAEIENWFARVASPLDHGLLASEPGAEPGYRAYRADHVDRLRLRDLGIAALFVTIGVALVGGIMLAMP